MTANDVAVEFDVDFAEKLSEETAHYITTADVYNEWYVAASGVQDVAKAQAIRSGLGEQVRNNVL